MSHKTRTRSETAICPEFADLIPKIVSTLAPAVEDVPTAGRQWAFYGSLPLGAGRPGSDLDIMLLHDGTDGSVPHRRDAVWDSRPVTIYVLSHDDLDDDADARRFGGYFALKLFSPYCTDRPERTGALAEAAARFLGPISSREAHDAGPWSEDQILAHAYLAFLNLYPDFASYVAQLARDPEFMGRVWAHQRTVHVQALKAVGAITSAGGGRWRYTTAGPRVSDDVRDRCAARFWAFGAVCHGADAGFPDLYFRKADARADRVEQDAALGLLHAVAAGGAPC